MNNFDKKYITITALSCIGSFILFLFVYMVVIVPQNNKRKIVEDQLAEKVRIYEAAGNAAKDETKILLEKHHTAFGRALNLIGRRTS